MAFSVFNREVTGYRPTVGSYVDGEWVKGAPVVLSIQTSVQPSPSQDLQLLPEGRRETGAYTLYTHTEVRNGDIFTLYGDEHEVLKVETWQNNIISHYKAIAVRMQKEGSL